jgi:very-short-patch-repair endonuclease
MVPVAPHVSALSPSPLVGEGGRRPDEGARRTELARSLRKRATEVEDRLWHLLRHRRLADFKFRRQVPIGPYVADFACFKARLVVELDGSQHLGSTRDVVRDAELERRGFRVLRFWNSQLNEDPEAVLNAIWFALQDNKEDPSSALRAPSPTRGEGDGADGLEGKND